MGEPDSWANAIMVDYRNLVKSSQGLHRSWSHCDHYKHATHADRLEGTNMTVDDLIDLACHIAKKAISGTAVVNIAGSIGPLVQSYRPDLHPYEEAKQKYWSNAKRLLQHKVQIILIETVSSLLQAKSALDGAAKAESQASSQVQIWLSVTVDDYNPSILRSGEKAEFVLPLAEAAGVEVLLINCSAPEAMSHALCNLQKAARERSYSNVRWGCYANAFSAFTSDFLDNPQHSKWCVSGKADESGEERDVSPKRFARYGRRWVTECHATVVGGCCATTPSHIRAISDALLALKKDIQEQCKKVTSQS